MSPTAYRLPQGEWFPSQTFPRMVGSFHPVWNRTLQIDLGSGPLLRMACTSPVSFNCFFFTITELINRCFHSWHLHIYIILPILFSTSKQENFHKPFEWYSTIKANTTHQYTSSFTFSPYN
jgi:hypothetical protein